MSTTNTGGPAFPMPGMSGLPNDGFIYGQDGMTLRDYFAAKANEEDIRSQAEVLRDKMMKDHGVGVLPDNWRSISRYMHADTMLKARAA